MPVCLLIPSVIKEASQGRSVDEAPYKAVRWLLGGLQTAESLLCHHLQVAISVTRQMWGCVNLCTIYNIKFSETFASSFYTGWIKVKDRSLETGKKNEIKISSQLQISATHQRCLFCWLVLRTCLHGLLYNLFVRVRILNAVKLKTLWENQFSLSLSLFFFWVFILR